MTKSSFSSVIDINPYDLDALFLLLFNCSSSLAQLTIFPKGGYKSLEELKNMQLSLPSDFEGSNRTKADSYIYGL